MEQGQNGVACSHSARKENRAEETLASPSSPAPAGTLPSRGRALPPSSCCAPQPLLHCCSCPGSINLSQGCGEDGDKEKRGLLHVSGRGNWLLLLGEVSPEGGGFGGVGVGWGGVMVFLPLALE